MAFSESLIGYSAGTLAAPGQVARGESLIGYAAVSLSAPSGQYARGASPIGFTSSALMAPHRPVVMLTASGYKRTAFRMFDGTTWR